MLGNIQEGDILPVIWMEVVPAQFPEEVQNAIYHSSFTANFVEKILKYGSVASTSAIVVFMLYLLVAVFYLKRWAWHLDRIVRITTAVLMFIMDHQNLHGNTKEISRLLDD